MIDLKFAHKFSKEELIKALVGERERHRKEMIDSNEAMLALKTIIKQAAQRLDLSKYVEVI